MARQVNQVLWDQWRQRTERQGTSGLPIVVFCRREGVSPAAFHAWKRKLRNSASPRRPASETAPARRSRRRPVAASLRRRPQQSSARSAAAAAYAEDFLQLPVRGVRSSPWIELSLVDGTLVRIPQENLAALTTLLRVLRGDHGDLTGREARRA
jgi:transposase-like protein